MESTFVLSDDHVTFRESVQRLARERFAPGYLERSRQDEYAFDTYRELGSLDLLGLGIPKEHGGQGADPLSLGLLVEALGWADQGVGSQYIVAALANHYIANEANDTTRERWLPELLSGSVVCCVAVTEPSVGSDAANMQCRADRVEGGWTLRGEKTSITSAPAADLAIVFAKTDPDAGARGVSAFLVPLADASITRQSFRDPGFRPVGRGSLTFDGTFVPDEQVLGELGRGFHSVMALFDLSRTLIGLVVTGAAQRSLDMATEYVTQRESFGKPISQYQGVSFPIAEHTARIHMLRIFCYHSLGLLGAGQTNTLEAAAIKWLGPELAIETIRQSIILHGHLGWSDEMPLHALWRDVSAYFLADGTPQIQKLLIARHVLGRDAVDG